MTWRPTTGEPCDGGAANGVIDHDGSVRGASDDEFIGGVGGGGHFLFGKIMRKQERVCE